MKAVKNFNPAIDGATVTVNGMEFAVCTILTLNGVDRFLLMPKREHRKRIRWEMDWAANVMIITLVRLNSQISVKASDEQILLIRPIVREDLETVWRFLNDVVHKVMDQIMSAEQINWN